MVESDFTIQEEGDFNQDIPSIKQIVLNHISKISSLCCEELTKGYWEERPLKVGGGIAITRTYKQDTRAAFCNSVDFLFWLVFPEADSTFTTKHSELKEIADIEERLKDRKAIFSALNILFKRIRYFDTMQGQKE